MQTSLRSNGTNNLSRESYLCSECNGRGKRLLEKDLCKKCKGQQLVDDKQIVTFYIDRGMNEGEKIVLENMGDCERGRYIPGDLIFVLQLDKTSDKFDRYGDDLRAKVHITLSEALTGFSRPLIEHLDGRWISISHSCGKKQGKILRPRDTIVMCGEGMYKRKSDSRGDLYLEVVVDFPEDGYFKEKSEINKIRDLLPVRKMGQDLDANAIVDEVEYKVAKGPVKLKKPEIHKEEPEPEDLEDINCTQQ